MARNKRVAGTIYLRVNGNLVRAVGDFSYNFGEPKKETVVGATGPDGIKTSEQVPFIEGTIRHTAQLDILDLIRGDAETVTLELANGGTCVLRDGTYCNEGTGTTEEGVFPVRWEGSSMGWIPAPQ